MLSVCSVPLQMISRRTCVMGLLGKLGKGEVRVHLGGRGCIWGGEGAFGGR